MEIDYWEIENLDEFIVNFKFSPLTPDDRAKEGNTWRL